MDFTNEIAAHGGWLQAPGLALRSEQLVCVIGGSRLCAQPTKLVEFLTALPSLAAHTPSVHSIGVLDGRWTIPDGAPLVLESAAPFVVTDACLEVAPFLSPQATRSSPSRCRKAW